MSSWRGFRASSAGAIRSQRSFWLTSPSSISGSCSWISVIRRCCHYCITALGLCESTAGRHIAAARVGRSYPQALDQVARGDLHASALSVMKKHLTADNADQLFELSTRKSTRQVEVLLAAQFPKPDVADSIRRLPTPNVGSEVAGAARPTSEVLAKSTPVAAEASNNHAPFCQPVDPEAPAAQKTPK